MSQQIANPLMKRSVLQSTAQEPRDADIIVIGGGPGGYTAAFRLAMLGAKTILVERDQMGGTCLNRGCIPVKALLHSAELYTQSKNGAKFGVIAQNVQLDMAKVNAYKSDVVSTLVKGVEGLLKARKIELLRGEACFVGHKTLKVRLNNGEEKTLTASHIIIAVGAKPASLPIPGLDGADVFTSAKMLDVRTLPASIAVIGGGVIGMELATAYARFGTKVQVIEAQDRILSNFDEEICTQYTQIIKKQLSIQTSAQIQKIDDAPDGKKKVHYTKDGQMLEALVSKVLLAVGNAPDTDALCLEKAGIVSQEGWIKTDEAFMAAAGIYCIGDANGRMPLAHAASAQGIYVADLIMGQTPKIDLGIIPKCVYSDPEIASVGLTEAEVKTKGMPYKVGRFPLRANGRSLVLNKTAGFVKIIGSARHNEVLGVHIMGSSATELIGECTMVMRMEGCVEDIANTIHAHPTVGESIMEAAASYMGGAVHSL